MVPASASGARSAAGQAGRAECVFERRVGENEKPASNRAGTSALTRMPKRPRFSSHSFTTSSSRLRRRVVRQVARRAGMQRSGRGTSRAFSRRSRLPRQFRARDEIPFQISHHIVFVLTPQRVIGRSAQRAAWRNASHSSRGSSRQQRGPRAAVGNATLRRPGLDGGRRRLRGSRGTGARPRPPRPCPLQSRGRSPARASDERCLAWKGASKMLMTVGSRRCKRPADRHLRFGATRRRAWRSHYRCIDSAHACTVRLLPPSRKPS